MKGTDTESCNSESAKNWYKANATQLDIVDYVTK